MSKTIATLFTGGNGVGVGARAAGYKTIWGVEFDKHIGQVAIDNGFPTMIADVREVDYASLEAPYWLHMSPVCKRASIANTKGDGEGTEDIETAEACINSISALNPPYVSLENVRGYEAFDSFHAIVRFLMDKGYNLAWWILNAADYGVPQTRERLILVGSRTERVRKPSPTHQKELPHDSQLSFFDTGSRNRWVGWLESIDDLVPSLEESSLAEWQWKFMPADLKSSLNQEVNTMADRGLLFDGRNFRYGNLTILKDTNPSFTVIATNTPDRYKAILIDCGNSGRNGKSTRVAHEPALTLTTGNRHKAMLCWQHRIVKMSVQCLARFQSFPDSYLFPSSATLASTVIGNSVPPLLMQRVIEAQRGE